jgi:(2Fe-2S) ferredoxin
MSSITPRWLVHCLQWVPVEAGIFRLNRVKDGASVAVECSGRDERVLPQTYVEYDEAPPRDHAEFRQHRGRSLRERLGQRIQAKGLADVGMASTGCIGFCSAGPLMVVYPEGIWYWPETPEDIDEIVDLHLAGNTPVERLVMVLTR